MGLNWPLGKILLEIERHDCNMGQFGIRKVRYMNLNIAQTSFYALAFPDVTHDRWITRWSLCSNL